MGRRRDRVAAAGASSWVAGFSQNWRNRMRKGQEIKSRDAMKVL